jgi:hypothetical protein
MAVSLDAWERPVLEAFARLEEQDPEGAWNYFYHEIVKAADGIPERAKAVCSRLRGRKLLTGDGRGQFATYYINDKGKEALLNA